MPSLLEVCPRGAWISEEHAVQFLGFLSKSSLRESFLEGNLPHVFVDHGKRFGDNIKPPYSNHRFFFVQKDGKFVNRPSINLASWVSICQSLEEGSVDSLSQTAKARIRDYTQNPDLENAYEDLKRVRAITFSFDLSGEDGDDGYRYGSNGGTTRKPSSSSSRENGEVYVREDGKKVRRVKRSNSTHASRKSLSGFLAKDDNDTSPRLSSGSRSVGDTGSRRMVRSKSSYAGSRSVNGDRSVGGGDDARRSVRRVKSTHVASAKKNPSLAGFLENDASGEMRPRSGRSIGGASEGEIYTRADGKRVRRVRKSSASVSAAPTRKNASLSGFLDDDPSKSKQRGSASVAGDQLAIGKESSLTGEIYVRADGKKVRRVKKPSSSSHENVEIITRPDGTKVRRIRKPKLKPLEDAPDDGPDKESPKTPTSTQIPDPAPKSDPPRRKIGRSLSGFLNMDRGRRKQQFSGSHSVAGDLPTDSEIYVRADGKKVRRFRKPKSPGDDGASLSGFLESDTASRPKLNGAATVVGESREKTEVSDKPETEIYVRPDGKKVRRIRKTAPKEPPKEASKDAEKKTLGGFLEQNASSGKKNYGGSNSVAGDQIAVSKEQSLTGEVYVRADGKRVRRVKKTRDSAPSPSAASSTSNASNGDNENVEIISRPDGTRVRRIRKTRPETPSSSSPSDLSGFLESQSKSTPRGSAATVTGAQINRPDEKNKSEEVRDGSDQEKKGPSLGSFFGTASTRRTGSASVAGDQVAISKEASLTGEVYIREDGKKVRRVRKSPQIQPGDQVEIITRPDGTKVRRIRRAKKPVEPNTNRGNPSLLDSHLKSTKPSEARGSSATVAGDMAEGEIYIRADGKRVRRVRKSSSLHSRTPSSSSASSSGQGEQYEIFVRPDGKKVRRIKKSVLAAQRKAESDQKAERGEPSLAAMLSQNEARSTKASSSATVAGDDITGRSSLQRHNLSSLSKEAPDTYSEYTSSTKNTPKVSTLSKDEEDMASSFRKMMKMRMPEGAIIQKMNMNGVPQHVQDSVLAGEVPATSAPAPQASSPQDSAAKASSLSSEEEEIATRYRKMVKMGMPEGAIIQKMSVDGVPQNIQNSVLAGEEPATSTPAPQASAPQDSAAKASSLSSEEEEIATRYRKMAKMGMPEGAIIQKMSVDGVPQNIQNSVLAGEEPTMSSSAPQDSGAKAASLSPEEEEIATKYRKMAKMGMPEGAIMQKMSVDGVAQNIQDSVLAREEPSQSKRRSSLMAAAAVAKSAPVPEGMALVQKDAATIPDGMVLVPKEQAQKFIPEGMVAVPKEKAGEGVPEGYVLVPKDQVRGDPGDDLILVRKDQIKDDNSPYIVLFGPDGPNLKKEGYETVDISSANIVSVDDLPDEVEKLKKSDGKGARPRFLLQALPEDKEMEDDFIRKNLLPSPTAREAKPEPPKKNVPSSTIAEVLAQMSATGGDFDAGKMQELLEKLETAEKRQKKLEKQLAAAGVAIAEDIDYDICIKKVDEIGKRMNEIGGSDVTHPDKAEQTRLREEYFKLEQEMEKYNSALLITDEYVAEQERIEKKWEADNAPANLEALKKLRRHMPVEVRNMSEAQLTNEPTPNGSYLPRDIARKFKRTNVLQIIRRDPDDIVRMHPSTLENMRVTGMTLTERRAVYEHLRSCGPKWFAQKAEKMTERKWVWYKMMKDNFKENLASYQRHVAQYGPPGAHPYATRANPNEGCPLIGKQCPLKADKVIDYDKHDYGYTDEAVYEVSEVRKADVDDQGAKAKAEALALMKEKKANERSDTLKKHYKGKLLQVAKANGSCESMDEIVEKMEFGMFSWIEDNISMGGDKSKLTDDNKKKEVVKISNVFNEIKTPILDICGRSGMQLSGKKTNDVKPDPRSIVECSLAEEVFEFFDVFTKYVQDRLKEIEINDTRIKSTIDMLKKLLLELHERNVSTTKALGCERLPRSRKLKTKKDIEDEIKEKMKEAEPPPAAAEAAGGPPLPGPPRGGLMDAIKGGRGRGGGRGGLLDAIQGRGRGRGGGRGGLLDAIQGRGRGGRGGRGGLLDAIQGRGRGGGGRGRGGLLDEISGRGRGRGGGGRGGLMDAIKARGSGGGGGRGDAGGRGGLLAAIQARGNGGD